MSQLRHLTLIVALLTVCTSQLARAAPMDTGKQPISVDAAFALCRAHPSTRQLLWIRGWFVPSFGPYQGVEGGLFEAQRAVPITTVDEWDVNGNWKRYGALYVHITTQSSFGAPPLTLHGRLDCATYSFLTDRDPFPPLPLKPVYGSKGASAPTPGCTSSGATPITTWAIAGGLKLTLTVPRRCYPFNALARVIVSIRNVSRHDIGYRVPGVSPVGVTAPQPEVLDQSGRILFPPAMPYMPPLPGPAPALVPLRPGQAIRATGDVVVRGPLIRASQPFSPNSSSSVQRPLSTLRTLPIRVKLTAESAPQLTLHEIAQGPIVDVIRPAGGTGQMLSLSYADCGFGAHGPNFSYTFGWVRSGSHLTPGCSPLAQWHLRVAWMNHPVAALDYTPPNATPTPTPLSAPSPTATPMSIPTPTTGPSFDELLRRADRAMAAVHTLHVTGIRTSVDATAQMSLRLQADCRSQSGDGIPILARTVVSGYQSQVGRMDEGYIIQGPVLPRAPYPRPSLVPLTENRREMALLRPLHAVAPRPGPRRPCLVAGPCLPQPDLPRSHPSHLSRRSSSLHPRPGPRHRDARRPPGLAPPRAPLVHPGPLRRRDNVPAAPPHPLGPPQPVSQLADPPRLLPHQRAAPHLHPRMIARSPLTLSLLSLVITGCAALGGGASSPSTTTRVALESHGTGPRIAYASNWHLYRNTDGSGSFETPLAALSTKPISCGECSLYFDSLSPGQALMEWNADAFPGWTLRRSLGRRVTIDGRPSKLYIYPGVDRRIGGILDACPPETTETIMATISSQAPFNWYEMLACLRGPGQTRLQRQVLAMLYSIRNAQ